MAAATATATATYNTAIIVIAAATASFVIHTHRQQSSSSCFSRRRARIRAMNNEERSDEEALVDMWYSQWEEQSVQSIESEPDYETQLHNEREYYTGQLWATFQTSATAISQLYKAKTCFTDRTQGTSYWTPFQTAAGTVTSLYKESTNAMRRMNELALEAGRQKRSKEIMNWARKKRRMIRREDLLAFIAGRPQPTARISHRSSPRPRMMSGSPPSQGAAQSMVISSTPPPSVDPESELHTFREAISGSPMSRRSGRSTELSTFINNELARHCKRPASHDVDMGSPTHKRHKFM
uniref:Uncharacterized protein n=1 Tax=Trichogramma kaykai TaxID=54128 RepID=A0ABD2XM20_9HYME